MRIYSINPDLGLVLGSGVNQIAMKVPWEDLQPGPVGECIEVIDIDPGSECCYEPVNLNACGILAQDGLTPAQGIPQFHQQSVYALAMVTIRVFEQGLGRSILWSPHRDEESGETFVQRLRIHPHALREPNAYYSPAKKALLLGYYSIGATGLMDLRRQRTAFTCLSHDMVIHETSHAILDGLCRGAGAGDSSPHTMATHEALCDLAGLLLHFSLPGILRSQANFSSDPQANENRLMELARNLAKSSGRYAELRDCIGKPELPVDLQTSGMPRRAAILVAAVFDVFLTLLRQRSMELLGLTRHESMPGEKLPPHLIDALSSVAAKSASHVLRMCIRAIDYCPPVDVNFGDFLRAMVTADKDVVPDDERNYRIAIVESFRRYGVYPMDLSSLSAESLLWRMPTTEIAFPGMLNWRPARTRQEEYDQGKKWCLRLSQWFSQGANKLPENVVREMGLAIRPHATKTLEGGADEMALIEVTSARLSRKTGTDGEQAVHWIITVSQRRRGYFDPAVQAAQDRGAERGDPDFYFLGGCTLLVDPATRKAKLCVAKDILSEERLVRARSFNLEFASPDPTFRERATLTDEEPFSALRIDASLRTTLDARSWIYEEDI
ncbi:MAG: hypothetical protein U1A53_26630 [Prosthecobacter sp.]|nr:hypothetical protein [Prosthecobacter sp.]